MFTCRLSSILYCDFAVLSFYFVDQEALPLFEKLFKVSKSMEGENYILASSYWGALHEIEIALQPVLGDSPALAAVRARMASDHFASRVTLSQSVSNPLHVLMHLCDPR